MTTFTAFSTLDDQDAAEALGEAMERLDPTPTGVGVIEVEDGSGHWEVGGYFTEAPDKAGLSLLAAAFGCRPFVVSELPDTDWVAKVKRELAPVVAGRFFVHGSHDADKVADDVIALCIEAAMAFGTGHHGTTQGCLLALDEIALRGVVPARVLDVGAGTAVLAMAAARVWPGAGVIASDIDAVAAEVAAANAAANGLGDRVVCLVAPGVDHPAIAAGAPHDLVFANILKGPLLDMAPDIARVMAPGGHLILSGILNEQADEVQAAYVAAGYDPVARREIVDWTTLTLCRI